jgi:hypothetical protein
MALLTGGVHSVVELKRGADGAPAFDANGEIMPCANVKVGNEAPFGPFDDSSRAFATIYFYERQGTAVIGPAMDRVYALLHRKCISSLGKVWETRLATDIRDQMDNVLDCSMGMLTFEIVRDRS